MVNYIKNNNVSGYSVKCKTDIDTMFENRACFSVIKHGIQTIIYKIEKYKCNINDEGVKLYVKYLLEDKNIFDFNFSEDNDSYYFEVKDINEDSIAKSLATLTALRMLEFYSGATNQSISVNIFLNLCEKYPDKNKIYLLTLADNIKTQYKDTGHSLTVSEIFNRDRFVYNNDVHSSFSIDSITEIDLEVLNSVK